MKKTYSKAELEKKAKDVFKEYPSAKSLFATTDGQFFLDKNRANLHAGAKGNVIEIENEFEAHSKSNSKDSDSIKPKSADTLIEEAKTIESIDLVELAKEVEAKGKNRKTVIEAYDTRMEELKTAE